MISKGFIAADNHFKNSEGWAKTNGFEYIAVKSKEEFVAAIPKLVSKSDNPILIEIFTDPINERQANKAFLDNNWKGTAKEIAVKSVSNTMKGIIGEEGINIIKKVVRKV